MLPGRHSCSEVDMKVPRRLMKLVLREDAKARRMGELSHPVRMTYRYTTLIPKRNGEVRFVVFAVRLSKDYRQPICTMDTDRDSVALRNVGFHGMAGWKVYWDEEECEFFGANSWYGATRFGEWSTDLRWKFRAGYCFPLEKVLNVEVLAQTRYRYHGWSRGNGIGLYDYLRLYREYPRVELLAKAGLWSVCNFGTLRRLVKNKALMEFIRTHRTEIEVDRYGINEINIAMRLGCTLEEARSRLSISLNLSRYGVVRHASTDEMADWIIRLQKSRKMGEIQAIQEYARYVRYAQEAGYDVAVRSVALPPIKGFADRLERIEREAARAERLKKRRESYAARKRRERARQTIKAIVGKFDGAPIKGFVVAIPTTQKALVELGKAMHNCVGDGRYAAKIRDGNSVIVALTSSGRSIVCIELDMVRGVVAQCYGQRNTVPPAGAQPAAEQLLARIKMEIKWRKAA